MTAQANLRESDNRRLAAASSAVAPLLEAPSIELAGVRIFASREGDHVTGRVEFPYEVCGRRSIPIDYHSTRPNVDVLTSRRFDVSPQAQRRLDLIEKYRTNLKSNPGRVKTAVAEELAKIAGISIRTLQLWIQKYDAEGVEALEDDYASGPRKVLSLDLQTAKDAILICAWWSFRIGNSDSIDSLMMHSATVAMREMGKEFVVRDLVAAIDCYYAWPCDRKRMEFKTFNRWAKYDVQKWLYRACDKDAARTNDTIYTSALARGIDPLRSGLDAVPLLAPFTSHNPSNRVADPRTRRRDVNHRGTRQSIAELLGENDEASPLRLSMESLDDNYRRMLFNAARGDSHERLNALSTMPLWWDKMPKDLTGEIDMRVHSQLGGVPKPSDVRLTERAADLKLRSFLAYLKPRRRAS